MGGPLHQFTPKGREDVVKTGVGAHKGRCRGRRREIRQWRAANPGWPENRDEGAATWEARAAEVRAFRRGNTPRPSWFHGHGPDRTKRTGKVPE